MEQNQNNQLEELEKKISDFEEKEKKSENILDYNAKSSYLAVGLDFTVTIAVASFLGYEIDKYLNTKPWVFLVFFVFGFITACYNIFRKV